jgi:hypothetical protein
MFHRLCGRYDVKNVILVTTMWSQVTPDVGKRREVELHGSPDFWKSLMERGARTKRFVDTPESAKEIVSLLFQGSVQPTRLQIQRELVDSKFGLVHMDAGREVRVKLEQQMMLVDAQLNMVKRDKTGLSGREVDLANKEIK